VVFFFSSPGFWSGTDVFVFCSTTFFSVVFATANSLRLQGSFHSPSPTLIPTNTPKKTEYLAHAISDYLTSETGVTIIFESAIVPKWKDSRISFKNVYISRRPSSSLSSTGGGARSGSGGVGHKAAVGYDVSSHPAYNGTGDDDEDGVGAGVGGSKGEVREEEEEEDTNYSYFDLNVDSIDVTLSLWRWLDGKGLVADAVVKGVRGVVGMFPSYPYPRSNR
jgi:mitochondrial distribution and morphology protein 31